MTYRPLGDSGLRVSVIGLGCNNFGARIDEAATAAVVGAAIDAGINLFDTAAAYGDSEELLGRVLAGRRNDVVLATKFPSPEYDGPVAQAPGSRHQIVAACERSLHRLQTDYVDLYQMHRPDPTTPVEETLAALDDLVRAGKVRYIGGSNFAGWQIADADWTARHAGGPRMISAQNEYSLLNREVERDVLPAARRFGLGLLPYFPLASGLLTGKYRRGHTPEGSRLSPSSSWSRLAGRVLTDRNFDVVEALQKVADDAGLSLLQLALGGILCRDGVSSVLTGATTPEQITANADAATWEPTPDVLAAIDAAAPGPAD